MGKPKKGKGSKGWEIDSDGEVDKDPIAKALQETNEEESGMKTAGKKGKKKKKKDVDDIFNEIAAMDDESTVLEDTKSEAEPATKGKKGKKSRKKKDDWDMDDIANEIEALSSEMLEDKAGVKASKTMRHSARDDSKKHPPAVEAPTSDSEMADEGTGMKSAAQKRAEKKERDKRKKDLQRSEAKNRRPKGQSKDEQEPEVPTPAAVEDNSLRAEDKKTKKKKGRDVEDEEVRESTDVTQPLAADVEDDSLRAEDKKTKKKKGRDVEDEEVRESTDVTQPLAEALAEAEGSEEEKADIKSKRKKKKKGKDEVEDKEKKKKPAKGQVRLMQEALKRMKEEEEKQKAAEEAAVRALELAEEKRLETLRLDKERKERARQEKKDRIDLLKKEGKYLTKSQEAARARGQLLLESFKQQGIEVPSKAVVAEENRTKVRYGGRARKRRKDQPMQKDISPEEVKDSVEDVPGTKEITGDPEPEKVEPETQESWDAADDWDAKDTMDTGDGDEDTPSGDVTPKAEIAAESKEESLEGSEEEEDEGEDSGEASSSSEADESDSESEDDGMTVAERIRSRAMLRIQHRSQEAEANRSTDNLRSPVVVVLGHVDTGKTKILDKIRHSHVQDGEAGGITQQIGATMVPPHAIREQTKMCRQFSKEELKIPGLLIIDTPGHESFSNLRSRGSSLCDIAILVVDIMHSMEPQTIESLNLLKARKTPFLVALNKIDVLYEWKSSPQTDFYSTIKKQKRNTKDEFDERVRHTITAFAEQGMNAALYYENPDPKTYVSLVPTSAHTGDGMGNLLALLVELSRTKLAKRLAFSEELQCTTMEVKSLTGLGTTVDVILVNGRLREGSTIVLAGQDGPIVTTVRGLLMPQPLKELRVKNQYQQHKEIAGAQGIKIIAKDLDKALAGMPLLVANHADEVDILKEEVAELLRDALKAFKVSDLGVHVHASTLGSLEALLAFLKTSKIPFCGIAIGPVHRRDVMKASVMLERDEQYAVILAFDVKIERDAQEMADREGIRIFSADIIYHLFDRFMAHREQRRLRLREEHKHTAVFPCKLRVIPQYIFNARNPIVVGVIVEGGIVKVGTPMCVPTKEGIALGVISSLEVNHKNVETARRGQEVCIKIEHTGGDAPKMYGRHFDSQDILVSKISRESIDAVKKYFREDLEKSDWQTMIELKRMQQIL